MTYEVHGRALYLRPQKQARAGASMATVQGACDEKNSNTCARRSFVRNLTVPERPPEKHFSPDPFR
jgi:hypothetical protein